MNEIIRDLCDVELKLREIGKKIFQETVNSRGAPIAVLYTSLLFGVGMIELLVSNCVNMVEEGLSLVIETSTKGGNA